jgi:hypothetical protein
MSHRAWIGLLSPCIPFVLVAASCSPTNEHTGFGGSAGAPASGGGGASTTAVGIGGSAGDLNLGGGLGTGGSPPTCTPGGEGDDVDHDGFTPADGDCNDCDPNVNPNAVEVVNGGGSGGSGGGEAYDEDCDGEIDEVDEDCDASLALEGVDPMDGARAVDLCKQSSGPNDWGVVSAKWVMADGSPPPALPAFDLGHGLLEGFGPNVHVRRGDRMLALSSGAARQPTDPGYQNVGGFDKGYTGNHPQGFPKESPACPAVLTGQPHDTAALELAIRVPSNAYGFSFAFDFFTYEWPGYVCSTYNDFFVAILSPIPANQTDGNISFDSQGNPVSVNNAFLQVCGCAGNPPVPCLAGGKSFTCDFGDVELIGTGFGFDMGFGDHGATSWLQTTAPAEPGTEITIRWGVYDSGDGVLDSTTLIDDFRWVAEPGTTVVTEPIPK